MRFVYFIALSPPHPSIFDVSWGLEKSLMWLSSEKRVGRGTGDGACLIVFGTGSCSRSSRACQESYSDMAMHFIRMRALTHKVIGMYVVRTDTELLEDDLSEWPKDKLCFLRRTTCDPHILPVNDMQAELPKKLHDRK